MNQAVTSPSKMSSLDTAVFALSVIVATQLAVCGGRTADDEHVSKDVEDPALSSNCVTAHCFHQPESFCPPVESVCRCRQLEHCRQAAVCCNVTQFQLIEGFACANISTMNGYVNAIHIRNATLDVLNLSHTMWRGVRYLSITDGHIRTVGGEFAKYSLISCLNLSANQLERFNEDRALANLFNLSYIDLSDNRLTNVPSLKKDGQITLDISRNSHLNCSYLANAINGGIGAATSSGSSTITDELRFHNVNDTYCQSPETFNWFNSTENVPLSIFINWRELVRRCPPNCTCDKERTVYFINQMPTLAVAVDCSNLALETPPTPLPPNTFSLNISNNKITSLDMINTDPTYKFLQQLYADNNDISSVLPLEGSHLLENFIDISLRHNKIKSLPTYLFSNVFDRNYNFVRLMKLGQNFLNCDCNTAKVLKVWLLTKLMSFPDNEEIFCDDEGHSKVITLNPTNYCHTKQDWTDYIYYIIAAEVLLLLGLVSKVCYDYWIFKTSGYLPWPANKIPKMPCDWLCE